MRWLALFVAALSLACLLVYADDSGTPRKKIVRRVLGCDSMRFPTKLSLKCLEAQSYCIVFQV